MNINENEAVNYIEPVFHFCVKRLNSRHDAEDLASEIMVHILDGIKKYPIDSLDGWVWRIAHNRYARWIKSKSKNNIILLENNFTDTQEKNNFVNDIIIAEEYQTIFQYLHSLSSEYRNIMVDYYIGQLPLKKIAKKYGLPETTVKRRLDISRKKIKTRIRENEMDKKVYKPIDWKLVCTGAFTNIQEYLGRQIARGICKAVYDKTLTVEEISLKTGIPAMYIEDELPHLIYGDALIKNGKKYATNFIILHLCEKKTLRPKFEPFINFCTDYFITLFNKHKNDVADIGFYGSDFTMERLGYIALHAVLRGKIRTIKNSRKEMERGPYPPRRDGTYGWFLVEKIEAESSDTACGVNISIPDGEKDYLYYYWIGKYSSGDVYLNHGTRWIHANNIIERTKNGLIPDDILTDDDRIKLIKNNLIINDKGRYKLNFPIFERKEYDLFKAYFDKPDKDFDAKLTGLIIDIHKSFKAFVPKRLDSQINQWVSYYVENIIGIVAEELIKCGILETPDEEKPMINGVFCLKGEYLYV